MPRQYQISGYSYSFDPEVMVTEFSTGNRIQRAKFKNRDTIFNVSEKLTHAEFSDFEVWVNTTLNGGADTFPGEYWDSDAPTVSDMTIVDGMYSYEYRSPNDVEVSYQIEVKNRDLSTGQAIYESIEAGVELTSEFVNLVEDAINNNNFSL